LLYLPIFLNLKIVAGEPIVLNLLGGGGQAMAGHPNTILTPRTSKWNIHYILYLSAFSHLKTVSRHPISKYL